MIRKNQDTRKYFVVRVKGFTETILRTYDDEGAAVDYMNQYGKRNRTGIIATIKGSLTEDGKIDSRDREQISVYDAWLEKLLKE